MPDEKGPNRKGDAKKGGEIVIAFARRVHFERVEGAL
jgi:hypothetical protein